MPSPRPSVIPRAPLAAAVPAWLLAVGMLLALPVPTPAQVRRCTAADGTSVFTDRRCEDVDSVSQRPATRVSSDRSALYRARCMRSIDELVFEMGLAFDSQDANRLAGLYHWTGMSSSSGYAIAERLDRLVHRPLIGIVPVLPEPPEPAVQPLPLPLPPADTAVPATPAGPPSPRPPGDWTEWGRETGPEEPVPLLVPLPDPATDAERVSMPPPPAPAPAIRRPVALRVEQTLSDGTTPSSTVFGLTRHFGCWWIRD